MGSSHNARNNPTPGEQLRDLDLRRCELTALGEWFVNISTRGRTQLVETHPKGYKPNTRAILLSRRVRR